MTLFATVSTFWYSKYMKRSMAFVVALIAFTTLVRGESLPPMDAMLDALSFAESRNNDNAVGISGERGRFQIMQETWLTVNAWRSALGYTAYPFSHATRPEFARIVAQDYLNYIRIKFEMQHGREPTLMELLTRWNRGPSATIPSKTTRQLYNRVIKALK